MARAVIEMPTINPIGIATMLPSRKPANIRYKLIPMVPKSRPLSINSMIARKTVLTGGRKKGSIQSRAAISQATRPQLIETVEIQKLRPIRPPRNVLLNGERLMTKPL